MNWTTEQQKAIELKGNLLVSAAAGSGKTAVLTERIVTLVSRGTSIENMLVVTFTSAAAEEMRRRIEKRLLVIASQTEEPIERERLYSEAAKVASANISTMHSFCSKLLKKHFCEAGLSPDFGVITGSNCTMMKLTALDELTEQYIANRPDDMYKLQRALGGAKFFPEAVTTICNFMESRPDSEVWLDGAFSEYLAEKSDFSSYFESMLVQLKQNVGLTLETVRDASLAFESIEPAYACLKDDMDKLQSLIDTENYKSFLTALFSILRKRKPAKLEEKCGFTPLMTVEFKYIRDLVGKRITDLKKMVSVAGISEADEIIQYEIDKLNDLKPSAALLYDFIRAYTSLYEAKKAADDVIDFADMEHKTLKVLEYDEIAEEFRAQFEYIFIDEYQDSNVVQESIIERIKRQDNLFMVGDVKQSIYRFRLAEPELFISRYKGYDGIIGNRIDLSRNFRSSSAVVDTVNDIFNVIMHERVAEIEYDSGARLRLGRENADGEVKVLILPTGSSKDLSEGADEEEENENSTHEDETDEFQTMMRDEREALVGAQQIRRIIRDERFIDPKTGIERPYEYSDFCIVSRAKDNLSNWLRILAAEGIPAYSESNSKYFETIEVQMFINVLRVVDNSRQDIPLVSVLLSDIGGFSLEELTQIRTQYRSGYFHTAFYEAAKAETELGSKVRRFIERLHQWGQFLNMYTVEESVSRIMDETGYYEYVGLLPGGEQRLSNLELVIDYAKEYEQGKRKGLHGFIDFLDRLKEDGKQGEKKSETADSDSYDAVRLMTIHKSKGLEFPVVILANASGRFSFVSRGSQGPVKCEANIGVGLKCNTKYAKRKSLPYKLIRLYDDYKERAELMRLLYVAMTRAVDKLFIIGSYDAGRIADNVLKYTGKSMVNDAVCFMDWIVGASMNSTASNNLRRAIGMAPIDGGEASYSIEIVRNSFDDLRTGAITVQEFDQTVQNASGVSFPQAFDEMKLEYCDNIATKTPSKLTVSMLSGAKNQIHELPGFMQDRGPVSASEKGTITHLLLKNIALKPHDARSVAEEIESLVNTGRLSPRQAKAIDVDGMVRFFNSSVGQRLIASSEVHRETMFNYRASARRFLDMDTDEFFILQGMIDCFFKENGRWILLDYKTDYIMPGEDVTEAAMKHEKQLNLYSAALADMTQIPVAEQYVCLLGAGAEVQIPFS